MKRIMLLAIFVCSLVMTAGPAFALGLSLDPPYQLVPLGGTASVDLVVLGVSQTTGLGAFDVEITYDPSILSFLDVSWGSFLGDTDELAPDPAYAEGFDNPFEGIVRLFEIGSLFLPVQPTSFRLATLNFIGEAIGFENLGLQIPILSDGSGEPLTVTTLSGARVSVPNRQPCCFSGAGLIGLAGFRKKFNRYACVSNS